MRTRVKNLLVLSFLVLQSSLVTGQGISGINDPFVGLSGLYNSINSWTIAPVTDFVSLVIYVIIPFVAVYFVTRFIFKTGGQFAVDNVTRNDRISRKDFDGEIGKVANALGLLGAVIATRYFPGEIFAVMLLSALAAPLFVVWMASKGYWNAMRPDEWGASGGSGGDGGDDIPSEIEEELEQLRQQNRQYRQELRELTNQQRQDEEAMNSGEEGSDEAENHIRQQLQELATMEQQLAEMESEVETIEEQIGVQEEATEQEEQEELELARKLENQQKKLGEALSQIEALEEEVLENENQIDQQIDAVSSGGPRRVTTSEAINTDAIDQELLYNIENLENIESMINQLGEMEQQEFQELRAAIEDEKDVLRNIGAQKEEIEALEQEVKELFQEVEILESAFEEGETVLEMAEKLAQKVKDREDYQSLEQEERVIDDLEQKFTDVLNEENKIRKRIKQLEQEEGQERSQHQKILNELQELEQSFEKTREMLIEIWQLMVEFEEGVEEAAQKGQINDVKREFMEKAEDRGVGNIEQEFRSALDHAENIREKLGNENEGLIGIMTEMEQELGELLQFEENAQT